MPEGGRDERLVPVPLQGLDGVEHPLGRPGLGGGPLPVDRDRRGGEPPSPPKASRHPCRRGYAAPGRSPTAVQPAASVGSLGPSEPATGRGRRQTAVIRRAGRGRVTGGGDQPSGRRRPLRPSRSDGGPPRPRPAGGRRRPARRSSSAGRGRRPVRRSGGGGGSAAGGAASTGGAGVTGRSGIWCCRRHRGGRGGRARRPGDAGRGAGGLAPPATRREHRPSPDPFPPTEFLLVGWLAGITAGPLTDALRWRVTAGRHGQRAVAVAAGGRGAEADAARAGVGPDADPGRDLDRSGRSRSGVVSLKPAPLGATTLPG